MPIRLIPIAKGVGAGVLVGALVAFIREIPVVPPREEYSILPSSIVGILGSVAAFLAVADAIHKRISDPAAKIGADAAKERAALEERIAQKQLALEERLTTKIESLLEKMAEGFATIRTQREDGLRRLGDAEETLIEIRIDDARSSEKYNAVTNALEKWEALIDKWRERDEDKYLNLLNGIVQLGGGKGGRHRRKDDPHDDEQENRR